MLSKKAKRIEQGKPEDRAFSAAHCVYIGFEVAKVTGLAVAGLRFGKMLTH